LTGTFENENENDLPNSNFAKTIRFSDDSFSSERQ